MQASLPCEPIPNRIRHETGQPEGFWVSFGKFPPIPLTTLTARLTSPSIIVISLFFLAGGLALLCLRNKVNVWPACFVIPFVSSASSDWFRAFASPVSIVCSGIGKVRCSLVVRVCRNWASIDLIISMSIIILVVVVAILLGLIGWQGWRLSLYYVRTSVDPLSYFWVSQSEPLLCNMNYFFSSLMYNQPAKWANLVNERLNLFVQEWNHTCSVSNKSLSCAWTEMKAERVILLCSCGALG